MKEEKYKITVTNMTKEQFCHVSKKAAVKGSNRAAIIKLMIDDDMEK